MCTWAVSAFVLALLFFSSVICLRTDQAYWRKLAENELEETLKVEWNTGIAKNVILFIGDGMGPNTVTATRIYKGGESHRLSYETFPHVGVLKTYSANTMVPDSSCTATALFSGVKVNKDTIGVDASVKYFDCDGSLKEKARLKSVAAIALEAGKSVGFVTPMRVTHATPGPLYAHSASRTWECDATMPKGIGECKDIARQLVEDWPGRDFHVIMGGGKATLVTNFTIPPSEWSCRRRDGRDLIATYKKDKQNRGLKYSYVRNTRELKSIAINETDYLLGIFADEHMSYEYERNKTPEGMPSLSEMTEAAIKVLSKNKNGFFLMVEGGLIDLAHHRGMAKVAVHEAAAMEDAVQLAVKMTNDKDTLLIVTSDHTHTLSINGYPDRGSNIFGISQQSVYDKVNYTILSYATGGPDAFQYRIKEKDNKTEIERREPSLEDTNSFKYKPIAAVISDESTHGGGDVIIYAKGPYAHLFHNVHEQNYVFNAICYSAKIGAYSSASLSANISVLLYLAVILHLILD